MHVDDRSIETCTGCKDPFSINTRQKPPGVCFSKVRVQLFEGLLSQLCMGMTRDSKSKYITTGANAHALNFLNSTLSAFDSGISIAAASNFTQLL